MHLHSHQLCTCTQVDRYTLYNKTNWQKHVLRYEFVLQWCINHNLEMLLTIDALEVEKVGSAVHLVQLQAHFHQVSCHRILPPHSQMVRVHHLQHTITRNLVCM